MTLATATRPAAVALRPLAPRDLDDVVAIDAALGRRSRRLYVERRLAAALREPGLHAQLGAFEGDTLAGYVLARVLEGEFGRSAPALRIELVGVRPDRHRRGVGRALLDALGSWGVRHGVRELRTSAAWNDHALLAWFDAMGFRLGPELIVDRPVAGDAEDVRREEPIDAPGEQGREVDYGKQDDNTAAKLARDLADVRTIGASDFAHIVRIDRRITGRDRSAYIEHKLAEALDDAGVRVSLTARLDGEVVGYLMARADLGDYGRTAPVAVLDTIGVDPSWAHRGVGQAMLSQLAVNLEALRIERIETVVAPRDFGLLGFLYAQGFAPSQRLAFERR
ncbi:MAG TPA: GNAT family N-acetyltransferase [Casimicrobiaceae bacterium]|nr:GNAT family N-acetyltransferase [Casimicrobiaceae bacterium]